MESEDGEWKKRSFWCWKEGCVFINRNVIGRVPTNHTSLSFGRLFSTFTILSNAGLKQHCKVSLPSSTYTFNFDLFH